MSLILVCRYLIADYERSTFSVNQCRFVENNDPDIRPIFPANATNSTTGTPPFDPDRKHDSSDLSPGIIAAIAVGSSVFLAILVGILILLRRRRSKGKTPNSDHLHQTSMAPEPSESKIEQELHADPIVPAELDGIGLGPREMEDSVAATEMSAVEGERHELHG